MTIKWTERCISAVWIDRVGSARKMSSLSLTEEEEKPTIHPEGPMVDLREVHVVSHRASVRQAQGEMPERRSGGKHMWLNLTFNAHL